MDLLIARTSLLAPRAMLRLVRFVDNRMGFSANVNPQQTNNAVILLREVMSLGMCERSASSRWN